MIANKDELLNGGKIEKLKNIKWTGKIIKSNNANEYTFDGKIIQNNKSMQFDKNIKISCTDIVTTTDKINAFCKLNGLNESEYSWKKNNSPFIFSNSDKDDNSPFNWSNPDKDDNISFESNIEIINITKDNKNKLIQMITKEMHEDIYINTPDKVITSFLENFDNNINEIINDDNKLYTKICYFLNNNIIFEKKNSYILERYNYFKKCIDTIDDTLQKYNTNLNIDYMIMIIKYKATEGGYLNKSGGILINNNDTITLLRKQVDEEYVILKNERHNIKNKINIFNTTIDDTVEKINNLLLICKEHIKDTYIYFLNLFKTTINDLKKTEIDKNKELNSENIYVQKYYSDIKKKIIINTFIFFNSLLEKDFDIFEHGKKKYDELINNLIGNFKTNVKIDNMKHTHLNTLKHKQQEIKTQFIELKKKYIKQKETDTAEIMNNYNMKNNYTLEGGTLKNYTLDNYYNEFNTQIDTLENDINEFFINKINIITVKSYNHIYKDELQIIKQYLNRYTLKLSDEVIDIDKYIKTLIISDEMDYSPDYYNTLNNSIVELPTYIKKNKITINNIETILNNNITTLKSNILLTITEIDENNNIIIKELISNIIKKELPITKKNFFTSIKEYYYSDIEQNMVVDNIDIANEQILISVLFENNYKQMESIIENLYETKITNILLEFNEIIQKKNIDINIPTEHITSQELEEIIKKCDIDINIQQLKNDWIIKFNKIKDIIDYSKNKNDFISNFNNNIEIYKKQQTANFNDNQKTNIVEENRLIIDIKKQVDEYKNNKINEIQYKEYLDKFKTNEYGYLLNSIFEYLNNLFINKSISDISIIKTPITTILDEIITNVAELIKILYPKGKSVNIKYENIKNNLDSVINKKITEIGEINVDKYTKPEFEKLITDIDIYIKYILDYHINFNMYSSRLKKLKNKLIIKKLASYHLLVEYYNFIKKNTTNNEECLEKLKDYCIKNNIGIINIRENLITFLNKLYNNIIFIKNILPNLNYFEDMLTYWNKITDDDIKNISPNLSITTYNSGYGGSKNFAIKKYKIIKKS